MTLMPSSLSAAQPIVDAPVESRSAGASAREAVAVGGGCPLCGERVQQVLPGATTGVAVMAPCGCAV